MIFGYNQDINHTVLQMLSPKFHFTILSKVKYNVILYDPVFSGEQYLMVELI